MSGSVLYQILPKLVLRTNQITNRYQILPNTSLPSRLTAFLHSYLVASKESNTLSVSEISTAFKLNNKIQKLSSFKSNENIHKREDGSYYVVSANKASSVTL